MTFSLYILQDANFPGRTPPDTSYKTCRVHSWSQLKPAFKWTVKKKKGRELYPAGNGWLPRKTIHFYMNSLTVGDLKVSYFTYTSSWASIRSKKLGKTVTLFWILNKSAGFLNEMNVSLLKRRRVSTETGHFALKTPVFSNRQYYQYKFVSAEID